MLKIYFAIIFSLLCSCNEHEQLDSSQLRGIYDESNGAKFEIKQCGFVVEFYDQCVPLSLKKDNVGYFLLPSRRILFSRSKHKAEVKNEFPEYLRISKSNNRIFIEMLDDNKHSRGRFLRFYLRPADVNLQRDALHQ
jgi:hypothetical protein